MTTRKLTLSIASAIVIVGFIYLISTRIDNTDMIDTAPTTGTIISGDINTGTVLTGSIDTGEVITGNTVKEAIAAVNNGEMITFNTDEDYVLVSAKFTQHFIDTYKYEDSQNFCFALHISQGKVGGYYNVYRNENGGVSNDKANHLDGCVPAYKFVEGVDFLVPLNESVALSNGDFGYHMDSFTKGKFVIYMSPVKETSWVNIFDMEVK